MPRDVVTVESDYLVRLRELRRVIDGLPLGALQMDDWVCGTQACVAGWAAQDPWFRDQGFELVREGDSFYPVYYQNVGPLLAQIRGWDAIDSFFGTSKPFDWLPQEGMDATPEQVKAEALRRIDEAIAAEMAEMDVAVALVLTSGSEVRKLMVGEHDGNGPDSTGLGV